MTKSLPIRSAKKMDSGPIGAPTAAGRGSFFRALLLAFTLCLGVLAPAQAADAVTDRRVTLDMRNAALLDVFSEIERQTGVVFVSNADDLKSAKRTDAVYTDTPLGTVLDELLQGQNLGYIATEDYVTIFRKQAPAQVQQQTPVTFTGRVLSASGEPMIGVTALEKGTHNGVITDLDGSFTITVAGNNSTIQLSMLGYRSVEIQPKGRNNLTISMEEEATGMEEIIVVAYGTQRKSSVTGSITTVSGSELTTVTSPNVNTMLQGKVAGVQVTNSSGRPGEAAKIRIRGKSTLGEGAVDPLWVIDGVISGTGSELNPNDIESMSILKDAAATALYGSRATNGVIIVTTKSGRVGENRVDVSAKFGIAQHQMGNFKLMNSRELYDYTMSMANLPDPTIDANKWLYDRDEVLKHDTDWYKLATKIGYTTNYTVSYTMGTEKVRNFLSGDYYRESGTVKGYTYQRYTFRDNIDIKAHERINLHIKIAASYKDYEDRQHDLGSAMNYMPWDYPYNEDGTIRTGLESDWRGRDKINYLYNQSMNWERGKELGLNGTFAFDVKITDWLTFESNNNIGYRTRRMEQYVDPNARGAEESHGSIHNENYLVTTRYTNQLLRFNYMLNNVHHFNAFLGYEFSDYFYEGTNATGNSIPGGTEVLNVAAVPYGVGGNKYGNALQSVYFNANYTYDSRYNAQFSFRTDGSSKFGPDKRYGNFWTVGAGWSIDREQFMQDVTWVDYLKLRGSYGSVGNQSALGNYDWMSTYTLQTNYNGVPAAFPSILGNYHLTWEKCFEGNVAIDARIFDRLSFVLDFYNKNTSDLLYRAPLTSVSGFTGQYQNIGSLRNRGFELTLSPDLINKGDWFWTMDFNFGLNRNKITELANDNRDQINGNYIYRVGHDRDSFYLAEWAGVDPYTGAPMWYQTTDTGERILVGDIGSATRVICGSSTPKWYGGISTAVSYKGFTLSALGNYSYGSKIYHYARRFYDNDGAYTAYNSMSLSSGPNWKRWEKPGDIATHPRAVYGGNNSSNENSSRYIESGSYFRLNNVTLSYELPKRWTDKLMLRSAQIYVSGENLWTQTKYSGIDVEVGSGKQNGISDLDAYPAPRRFSFGINFSF